jgi:hypothetical protein
VGDVAYIQKRHLAQDDVLGQNVAFFRQWRLSEIDYADGMIKMKPCGFAKNCLCPQTKENAQNPYSSEIPIWNLSTLGEGKHPLGAFNRLDKNNGGTAVIVWTYTDQQTYFWDVHGSLQDILLTADSISKKYGVDPSIAISDAGVYAPKIRANANNKLDFNAVNQMLPSGDLTGAGFAYLACSTSVYKLKNELGEDFLQVTTSDDSDYLEWKKRME